MKVSCIIPNYNSGNKLLKVAKLCLTYSDEVMVVDDKSTDNSLRLLNTIKDKRLKIFRNKSNKGSSYSRNLGFKKSKNDHLLFIDSDCYLNKKSFLKLTTFDEEIIYPKIVDTSGKIYNYLGKGKYIQNSVCFLIKKSTFKKIGGFDEKIKIYMDDVDFFFRCYNSGVSLQYVPASKGVHDSNKKTLEAISRSFFSNLKNTVYFCLKNKRGITPQEFPTWVTIFANIRRAFLNKDRFYNQPLASNRLVAIFNAFKSILEGFILYF